jgi:hypothetical protein
VQKLAALGCWCAAWWAGACWLASKALSSKIDLPNHTTVPSKKNPDLLGTWVFLGIPGNQLCPSMSAIKVCFQLDIFDLHRIRCAQTLQHEVPFTNSVWILITELFNCLVSIISLNWFSCHLLFPLVIWIPV